MSQVACRPDVPAACGFRGAASLSISADATRNVTCVAKKCAATAKNAVLNAGELTAMLANSPVIVKTSASAEMIEVAAPLSWASGHVLTLSADLDVRVKAAVTVEGRGGVTVTTDTGGSGSGDLKFSPGGKIDFQDTGARFILNGRRFKLVGNLAALAAAYENDEEAVVALARDYDAGQDNLYKDVHNAYAIGAVIGATPPRHDTTPKMGGVIGSFFPGDPYTNAYWDIDTTGMTAGCGYSSVDNGCPATVGLSDAELKAHLPAGFDPAVWGQAPAINGGYPYLLANLPE